MRRAHRKSRAGCVQCKSRHIKCDETPVRCRNCTRQDFACSFGDPENATEVPSRPSIEHHTRQPTSATAEASSLTDSPHDSNSTSCDFVDLELLQNFNNGLDTFLSRTTERQWCGEFVQIGLNDRYVLHSMLAVSALHILNHSPHRTEFKDKALTHYSAALETVQPHLSEPTEAHAIPLFLFSLYVNIYGHAVSSVPGLDQSSRGDGDVAGPQDALSELSSCIGLARGLRTIVYGYWDSTIKHFLIPKMSRPLVKPGDDPDYARCPPLAELRDIVESLAVPDLRPAYIEAVDHLALFYIDTLDQAESERHTQWIQSWPVSISDTFLQQMDGHDRVALIITAHYTALMSLKSDVWWLKHWPKAILLQITQLLGTLTASTYLRWPWEMVQST